MMLWRRMKSNSSSLSGPSLGQDLRGDADLAEVVQLGGALHQLDVVGGEAERLGAAPRPGSATSSRWLPRPGWRSSSIRVSAADIASSGRVRADLGRVHPGVGEAQRRVGSWASPGTATTPDADVIRKPSPSSLSASCSSAWASSAGRRFEEQDAELVAAEPGRDPAALARGRELAAEAPQQRIAGGMAEGVVVALEAVEIGERQREALVRARSAARAPRAGRGGSEAPSARRCAPPARWRRARAASWPLPAAGRGSAATHRPPRRPARAG